MKRKAFLLLSSIFLGFHIYAQDGTTIKTKRIKIGIGYAPSLTYRVLRYSDQQHFLEIERNDSEIPKYGQSLSLLAQKEIFKKNYLELGVCFSDAGYQTRETNLTWVSSAISLPDAVRTKISYRHMGLYARYKYEVFGSNIKFYLGAGFAFEALMQRKTTVIEYKADRVVRKSNSTVRAGYSEINFSPILLFGTKLKISEKFMVCLEPIYKAGLVSIAPGYANREFLYSLGMNTILLYKFTKRIDQKRKL
jgi:hypothetical protein